MTECKVADSGKLTADAVVFPGASSTMCPLRRLEGVPQGQAAVAGLAVVCCTAVLSLAFVLAHNLAKSGGTVEVDVRRGRVAICPQRAIDIG